MKMKKIIFSLLLCFATVYLHGQDLYMYVGGQKQNYRISATKMLVKSKTLDSTGIKNEVQRKFSKKVRKIHDLNNRLFMADMENTSKENIIQMEKQWNTQEDVSYVSPVLLNEDGREIGGFTNQVIVRLLSLSDSTLLQKTVEAYQIKSIQPSGFDDRTYLLTLDKGEEKNAMQIAGELHDTGLFEYAEPNLINFVELSTADTYYLQQWGLKNTGQFGGTSGVDIRAEQAWQITTGSSNTRIAILDMGVDLNHPDLVNNLLQGYDATGNNSAGAPIAPEDVHGTACAGIAAAQSNSIGIAGVAYGCRILPVRVGNGNTMESTAIAAGINWARQNNADVISMSFGSLVSDNVITTAINTAAYSGRSNGLGCVLVAAAGNDNSATVNFPASNSNVIAVGAMSPCGTRKRSSSNKVDLNQYVQPDPLGVSCDGEGWWGSNYGTNLGVVAPGTDIYTTCMLNAPNGYSIINNGTNGVYTSNFNGTSAATPCVAGVAALIFSMRPDLNPRQVRTAIETTCRKDIPGFSLNTYLENGSWSDQVGYGLVDAYAAVLSVLNIVGPTILCPYTNVTYTVAGKMDNNPITWTYGSNFTLVSSSGNSITLRNTATTYQGGTIAASYSGIKLSKLVYCLYNPVQLGQYSASAYTNTNYTITPPQTADVTGYNWVVLQQPANGATLSNTGLTCGIRFSQTGTYVIYAYGNYGCAVSNVPTYIYIYNVTSPSGANSSTAPTFTASAYPNPVSSSLNIEIEGNAPATTDNVQTNTSSVSQNKTDDFKISLYDEHGKIVHHAKAKKGNKAHFSVAHLKNGIYYLNIYDETTGKTEKQQIIVKH